MSHNEVYKHFENEFPDIIKSGIECWFPNGHNSIRIRTLAHEDYVYIYDSPTKWAFETIERFIHDMKSNVKGD